jgi:hypothetical protein
MPGRQGPGEVARNSNLRRRKRRKGARNEPIKNAVEDEMTSPVRSKEGQTNERLTRYDQGLIRPARHESPAHSRAGWSLLATRPSSDTTLTKILHCTGLQRCHMNGEQ